MAESGAQLDSQKLYCSICLDVLNYPVTISCGHSYCGSCIKSHWDEEKSKGMYSCPQCRERFRRRLKLKKNFLLAELVEDLKKTGHQAAAGSSEKRKEVEASRLNVQQRIQEWEKEVELLQRQVEAINVSADEAVEHSEESFTQMIRLLRKRSREVKQQLRSQQQTAVSGVRELQGKLQQEIAQLKRKDVQLERLAHTEDHSQFLHSFSSVSALSEPSHSPSVHTAPLRYFEDVAAAVSESREKLKDVLGETETDVSPRAPEEELSLPQAQPETREDFLQYSQQIHLDPNTAHRQMLLSDRKRKVTFTGEHQPYPDHPGRFTNDFQVLSRESLTGRCYWEVEWRGGVNVAVAYKNISRSGRHNECLFGSNNKSWALLCDSDRFTFSHNNTQTLVSGPPSSRVGVYLDHRAGVLSFHSISGTMTLLHRVQTTFSQPLHAGVGLYCEGASAELVKLQ